MIKSKHYLKIFLFSVIVIYIFYAAEEAPRNITIGSHSRTRRHIYPSNKKRPCPDGGTCCSLTFFDSDYDNQSFYLKCGAIPKAYPPCRRIHRSHRGFPACCPILACPPYFTYIDAFVYTISLLKSTGKAVFQYGKKGNLTKLLEH